MRFFHRTAKWVPATLGTAMCLVIVAAAVAPNIGVVSAQTTCQYGTCTSSGPTATSYILLGVLIAVIVAAAIVFLLYRRSRSRGGGGVAAWEAPPAGAAGAATAGPSMDESPVAPVSEGGYLETPEDVEAPMAAPIEPVSAPTPSPGGEGDIDSLMQELDKISGEILRRGPSTVRKPPTQGSDPDAASDTPTEDGDGGGSP